MNSGHHAISLPRASMASLSGYRMIHWCDVTISSGRVPFSQNFTGCVMGRGSPSVRPASVSSSTMRAWACLTVRPASSS